MTDIHFHRSGDTFSAVDGKEFRFFGVHPWNADNINIESEINNFRNQLKTQNINDVNDGKYLYGTSVVYMDLIAECEKMGDYIVNVVEAEADTKLN